jgi:3-methylfumaryl-CoA hydratase
MKSTAVHELSSDIAAARQATLLAALLDQAEPPWREGELPPLAHWLLFPPTALQSAIGTDGHPRRSDEGLPRRMWAGSRIRFLAPLPLDSAVERETTQLSLVDKTGRSGKMQFLTLRHLVRVNGVTAIEEDQDIVYREAVAPGASAPPPPTTLVQLPPFTRPMQADPVQLLRFSALTFNAHRIHYDRPYAMEVEGYPGLVVHGPYIATLLMDLYLRRHPGAQVAAFTFRAMRPIFDMDPFTLGLTEDTQGGDLVAIDHMGGVAMQARVDMA